MQPTVQRKYHNFWTYSVEGLPNTSTTRETAFAKIRARVIGTLLAAKALEGASGRK